MRPGGRRSIRLRGYDYTSPGAYFVTICTVDRLPLFGELVTGKMQPTGLGILVEEEWVRSESIRSELVMDACVIMPDHLHGIVTIETTGGDVGAGVRAINVEAGVDRAHGVGAHGLGAHGLGAHGLGAHGLGAHGVGAHGRAPLQRAPRSLGSFVAGFKSRTTLLCNRLRGTPGHPLWQRGYYEHIIRNETELTRIRRYIEDNPARWSEARRAGRRRRGE